MKVYEQDNATGLDHKGYSMRENTHEFIAKWQHQHGLPNLTAAFQDIVEKVKTLPALEQQAKDCKHQLEFLKGKASLSGMDFDKPFAQSIQEQANQKAADKLKEKELAELREKVEKLTAKLKKKSDSRKAMKKRLVELEAEANKDKINMNGILKDCIKNPQSLGVLFNGLRGNAQVLQGLPEAQNEEAKEAMEFLKWFEELFPEANNQETTIEILQLLSSNTANIKIIKQLLTQNLAEAQNTDKNDSDQHSSER